MLIEWNIDTVRIMPNHSSIASPICQEEQSERTFPIFAFSSRFPPSFYQFFHLFPDFWQIFCCQGGHSALLAPILATPLPNQKQSANTCMPLSHRQLLIFFQNHLLCNIKQMFYTNNWLLLSLTSKSHILKTK